AIGGQADAFVAKVFRHSTDYTITGRVTKRDGVGLSHVTIMLNGTQQGSSQTDADGYYAFVNLEAGGDYTVTPSGTKYRFRPVSWTFNDLNHHQGADFIGKALLTPLAAAATYVISGRVVDRHEAPLSGTTMTLSGSQTGSTSTDGNGNYSFVVPAGGGYT